MTDNLNKVDKEQYKSKVTEYEENKDYYDGLINKAKYGILSAKVGWRKFEDFMGYLSMLNSYSDEDKVVDESTRQKNRESMEKRKQEVLDAMQERDTFYVQNKEDIGISGQVIGGAIESVSNFAELGTQVGVAIATGGASIPMQLGAQVAVDVAQANIESNRYEDRNLTLKENLAVGAMSIAPDIAFMGLGNAIRKVRSNIANSVDIPDTTVNVRKKIEANDNNFMDNMSKQQQIKTDFPDAIKEDVYNVNLANKDPMDIYIEDVIDIANKNDAYKKANLKEIEIIKDTGVDELIEELTYTNTATDDFSSNTRNFIQNPMVRQLDFLKTETFLQRKMNDYKRLNVFTKEIFNTYDVNIVDSLTSKYGKNFFKKDNIQQAVYIQNKYNGMVEQFSKNIKPTIDDYYNRWKIENNKGKTPNISVRNEQIDNAILDINEKFNTQKMYVQNEYLNYINKGYDKEPITLQKYIENLTELNQDNGGEKALAKHWIGDPRIKTKINGDDNNFIKVAFEDSIYLDELSMKTSLYDMKDYNIFKENFGSSFDEAGDIIYDGRLFKNLSKAKDNDRDVLLQAMRYNDEQYVDFIYNSKKALDNRFAKDFKEEMLNKYKIELDNIKYDSNQYKEDVSQKLMDIDNDINTAKMERDSLLKEINEDKINIKKTRDEELSKINKKLTSINEAKEQSLNTAFDNLKENNEYIKLLKEDINNEQAFKNTLGEELYKEYKDKIKEVDEEIYTKIFDVDVANYRKELNKANTLKKDLRSQMNEYRQKAQSKYNENIKPKKDNLETLISENRKSKKSIDEKYKTQLNELSSEVKEYSEKIKNVSEQIKALKNEDVVDENKLSLLNKEKNSFMKKKKIINKDIKNVRKKYSEELSPINAKYQNLKTEMDNLRTVIKKNNDDKKLYMEDYKASIKAIDDNIAEIQADLSPEQLNYYSNAIKELDMEKKKIYQDFIVDKNLVSKDVKNKIKDIQKQITEISDNISEEKNKIYLYRKSYSSMKNDTLSKKKKINQDYSEKIKELNNSKKEYNEIYRDLREGYLDKKKGVKLDSKEANEVFKNKSKKVRELILEVRKDYKDKWVQAEKDYYSKIFDSNYDDIKKYINRNRDFINEEYEKLVKGVAVEKSTEPKLWKEEVVRAIAKKKKNLAIESIKINQVVNKQKLIYDLQSMFDFDFLEMKSLFEVNKNSIKDMSKFDSMIKPFYDNGIFKMPEDKNIYKHFAEFVSDYRDTRAGMSLVGTGDGRLTIGDLRKYFEKDRMVDFFSNVGGGEYLKTNSEIIRDIFDFNSSKISRFSEYGSTSPFIAINKFKYGLNRAFSNIKGSSLSGAEKEAIGYVTNRIENFLTSSQLGKKIKSQGADDIVKGSESLRNQISRGILWLSGVKELTGQNVFLALHRAQRYGGAKTYSDSINFLVRRLGKENTTDLKYAKYNMAQLNKALGNIKTSRYSDKEYIKRFLEKVDDSYLGFGIQELSDRQLKTLSESIITGMLDNLPNKYDLLENEMKDLLRLKGINENNYLDFTKYTSKHIKDNGLTINMYELSKTIELDKRDNYAQALRGVYYQLNDYVGNINYKNHFRTMVSDEASKWYGLFRTFSRNFNKSTFDRFMYYVDGKGVAKNRFSMEYWKPMLQSSNWGIVGGGFTLLPFPTQLGNDIGLLSLGLAGLVVAGSVSNATGIITDGDRTINQRLGILNTRIDDILEKFDDSDFIGLSSYALDATGLDPNSIINPSNIPKSISKRIEKSWSLLTDEDKKAFGTNYQEGLSEFTNTIVDYFVSKRLNDFRKFVSNQMEGDVETLKKEYGFDSNLQEKYESYVRNKAYNKNWKKELKQDLINDINVSQAEMDYSNNSLDSFEKLRQEVKGVADVIISTNQLNTEQASEIKQQIAIFSHKTNDTTELVNVIADANPRIDINTQATIQNIEVKENEKVDDFQSLSKGKKNLFYYIMNEKGISMPTEDDYKYFIETFGKAKKNQVEDLLKNNYDIKGKSFIRKYGNVKLQNEVLNKYR